MHDVTYTDNDILLTSDVARELGLARETVLQLNRSGKLPAMRTVRGQRLFRRGDVERLKRQREERKRA